MYVCVYICPWSGPPGAREERKRLSEPSWSPNKCVCVCVVDEGPCYFVLGEPPQLGVARFPKTISIP